MQFAVSVVLIILMVVFAPFSGQAFDFQSCEYCHGTALSDDNNRMFIHSPYGERHCDQCHAAESTVSAQQASVTTKSLSTSPQKQGGVNWLGESVMVDTSHGFLLPSNKIGNSLLIDVQGVDGRFSRREVAVPLLADLAEVQDGGQPPVISDVKVLKVERRVFLSATIGWQTDTLTDGLVRYGSQTLSQRSGHTNRFGRKHEVVLSDLKVDQKYRFMVTSTDIFGRSRSSDPLEFSTSHPYRAPLPATNGHLPGGTGEISMTDHFQRLGSKYLVELNLEQPAAVYVGTTGPVRQQALPAANSSGTGASVQETAHSGLSGEEVSTMGACQPCHEHQETATHPVNVYPKPGMTIPPEYPTLPDGRITCCTCHTPHSSNYLYLARKQSKRELCLGCHKDMI